MSSPPSDLTVLRLVWLGLALLGVALTIWGDQVQVRPSEWVALACLGLWCLIETSIRRNWAALLTIPAMVLGIGCALPLYLFFRSRRIA
ncbi:DUF2834 domain-containing protein [Paracoccus sp. DMF-8]|uniref:DUF2834 domain-containing protein n=1 Tax=Paracoccus sp. DMF-8 TaxID=3019445 RepID=UPI0023E4794D|nr:DUF2834 domain-containing protein [Paracoccus sp. DMF-8]MDF3607664.1 DUF2834 domain-containing protein [Paracoccus sp. DMF-8]